MGGRLCGLLFFLAAQEPSTARSIYVRARASVSELHVVATAVRPRVCVFAAIAPSASSDISH